MTKPSIYTTMTFIRVPEIGERECWWCVANHSDEFADDYNEMLCVHLQNINGRCQETGTIYIIDHPEHIADYTKRRITK